MSALYDWTQLLKFGGRIFIETSDIFGIIDVMREASDFETAHNWKICLFGNQAHAGDFHFNGFTVPTLRTYLRAVGLFEDGINVRDKWLIQAWATKVEDWRDLEAIDSYTDFLVAAFDRLLYRMPEEERFGATPTRPDSFERKAEIKNIVCSEERLYKIGAGLAPITPTISSGPPAL